MEQQKDAVERYAHIHDYELIKIFEDQLTAAKSGRPAFNQMLTALKLGHARGVIIHKIDRSARNLKDWADLGELIDSGVEVHFANESLDLTSRGGRLSADIQAVVAADYIRNLREETKKGFYGRLKQGLFPLPAPIGYLDAGKGQLKVPDPVRAPLVKKAFRLYATGKLNLQTLNHELYLSGLRTKSGKRVSVSTLSWILNNSFYCGVITIKKTGEIFEGKHHALVSPELFELCQNILHRRTNTKTKRDNLIFRRLLTCSECQRTLIGESHDGIVYYRCQHKDCPMTTIREDLIEERFKTELERLILSKAESVFFKEKVYDLKSSWAKERLDSMALLESKAKELTERLSKLTSAFLDDIIERDIYEEQKKVLIAERKSLEAKITEYKAGRSIPDELTEFLEFTKSARRLYETAFPDKRRNLVQIMTSKNLINKKSLVFGFKTPFNIMLERPVVQSGCPSADVHRDGEALWTKLVEAFKDFRWSEI